MRLRISATIQIIEYAEIIVKAKRKESFHSKDE